MGVLDDAIREHIELKRQHGVSEQDLARQEQEALGPARRETAAAQQPTPPAAEPIEVQPPAEEAAPEPALEEFAAAAEVPEEPALEPEPLDETEPEVDQDVGADPGVEEDEDVLEETPEFLQETPEHDRLWFEQKPPRDFDFDE